MKKIKIAFLVILLFISQSVFSQFKLSIGPSLGVAIPSADYGGTTVDFYNGVKYGLGSAVNFGVIFKAKLPVFKIRAGVNYSAFSNTGNSETDKPNSFIEVKQSYLMFTGGAEFGINIPKSPITPYGGIDLLFTSLSGQTTFTGVAKVPSGTYSMSGAARFGLGFGAGAEISIGKKYALDIGVRYNLINLFSKSFTSLSTDERVDSYVNLNDDADPNFNINDKHPIGNSRNISTLTLNAAFLFGF